ncbi:hypothetical protein [Aestuariirhabdus litorea]|nr:hypothetical protein [Aestuariirhabdus litorea]
MNTVAYLIHEHLWESAKAQPQAEPAVLGAGYDEVAQPVGLTAAT